MNKRNKIAINGWLALLKVLVTISKLAFAASDAEGKSRFTPVELTFTSCQADSSSRYLRRDDIIVEWSSGPSDVH